MSGACDGTVFTFAGACAARGVEIVDAGWSQPTSRTAKDKAKPARRTPPWA